MLAAMNTPISEEQLKQALKAAVLEILEERGDLLRDVIEEAFEDIALARAIEEGQRTDPVTRDEVFRLIEDRA
jgi:hypothetical protein